MTKAELLGLLAIDAKGLNLAPPTSRALEDWVHEGLIERATARGRSRGQNPLWSYSENAVETARCILKLRSAGISRVTAVRVHLWVRGHNLNAEKVLTALKNEFHRFLQAKRRRGEWELDLNNQTIPTSRELVRHDRQLGTLDPRFAKAGLRSSRQKLLETASAVHWGNVRLPNYQLSSVSGLFGNSDEIENAGEQQITLLTYENLENARNSFADLYVGAVQFQAYLFGSSTPFANIMREAYAAATAGLLQHDFLISTFAALAVSEFSSRKDAAQSAQDVPADRIKPLNGK